MFNKILVFSCVLSAACASVVPVASPLVAAPVAPLARVADYDPIPQYSYGYDVQDSLTGDYKGHQESRNGDVVQGSYSVVDPDGTRRIVDYAADPINGFNAVVRREPIVARAAVPVAPVAPVAPAAHFAPAPLFPPARLASPPLFYPF